MSDYILEMIGITKTFPGVRALDDVTLRVREGEIHALCGENGAGKSTLMNVLSGVYPYGTYEGEIRFRGRPCQFRNIRQSEEMGIVIIHQELALVPDLSIAENLFLGHERARRGIIDWNETIAQARQWMQTVGLDESPLAPVSSLGVGKQQLVEIAKALSKRVQLLILDEPTAALNEEDSDNLLNLIVELKRRGISSIIISHKLQEVLRVADAITVLRDGKTVETFDVRREPVTEERIIRAMVGRDLTQRFPERKPNIGDVLFEIRGWTVRHPSRPGRNAIDGVDLYIRRGEIVGIAGLMGAGRTELALSIFGRQYGHVVAGRLYKNGREIRIADVRSAIAHGLAYVTEDRKQYGLVLIDDIRRNVSLAALRKVASRGVIREYQEISVARQFRERLNIKAPNVFQKTGNLSGGNQQKVVLSKWIFADPDVLILDEPTRGIDVGAKYEIYTIIHRLADEGKGILLISSELPEILGLCDRIYVMSEGRITGEFARGEADQERLMKHMTQGRQRRDERLA
ncbi:MAG: ABC transporter ATP-binding protein [Candidatus Reconcilbacillus cellulovorans]|uniref:ABC transporter ATP-binding protein n=1 Tax=Candidatus Reconcilbacillus cellulovorans TaxID=1906605 RepID=A0A2A6E0E1_9BACL|nr:MAG: ABC transporter ATP-binding protein [Candidatus Reconcilbacillus cellulovorans]